jgi:hypothetical protein
MIKLQYAIEEVVHLTLGPSTEKPGGSYLNSKKNLHIEQTWARCTSKHFKKNPEKDQASPQITLIVLVTNSNIL